MVTQIRPRISSNCNWCAISILCSVRTALGDRELQLLAPGRCRSVRQCHALFDVDILCCNFPRRKATWDSEPWKTPCPEGQPRGPSDNITQTDTQSSALYPNEFRWLGRNSTVRCKCFAGATIITVNPRTKKLLQARLHGSGIKG